MKLLFFMLLLRGANPDSLPPKAELFATLRAFHAETEAANLEPLNVQNRFAKTALLPSVGITLGKPTIGFSFAQIANFYETKALRKAEKAKILRGANLAFKTDSFTLVSQLEKWQMLNRSLPYLESVERIENEQFEVQKAQNTEGSILPLDWLRIKAEHLKSGEPYRKRIEEIELLEIEIRKTAKY